MKLALAHPSPSKPYLGLRLLHGEAVSGLVFSGVKLQEVESGLEVGYEKQQL